MLDYLFLFLLHSSFCEDGALTMSDLPPVARIEIVKEQLHGSWYEDPYRWLEDWQSEEARNFLEAQAHYSSRLLKDLPERETLLARISELNEAGITFSQFKVRAGRYFYLLQSADQNTPALVMRECDSNVEKILVDPNSKILTKPDYNCTIDWFLPIPRRELGRLWYFSTGFRRQYPLYNQC